MYIDDISKLQSNKNTVDNNLKDSIVFTSKPDSLKFQEEQYENTYPKYEEALECEKNGDYEKALEIHYDILKNHVPIGSSYYAAPISLLEKSNHFEEAIKICDLAIHNIKKYNLHFDASDFENWKNKLYYQIKLSNELIPYIKNNPGILQKDIYKNFNMEYKYLIQQILYDMDKNNKIIRKKHGNSYELYIKN
jgi:tetratricopeptide (TPR) repeat protein